MHSPWKGRGCWRKGQNLPFFLPTEAVSLQAVESSSAAQVPGDAGNPGCCPFKTWGEKDANEELAEN